MGGGLRAFSMNTGLLAGVISVKEKMETRSRCRACWDSEAKGLGGVLDSFDVLSTVSAGSWFMGELCYSKSFLELIEILARCPRHACTNFSDRWVTKLIDKVATADSAPSAWIVKAFDMLHSPGLLQDIQLISYLVEEARTWLNLVSMLTSVTAELPDNLTLGDESNAWCRGKQWLICHSLMTPTPSAPIYLQSRFWKDTSVTQTIEGRSELNPPQFVPAMYSCTLGLEEEEVMPHSYVAESALPDDAEWAFKACNSFFCAGEMEARTSVREGIRQLMRSPQRLSVNGCLAASSDVSGYVARWQSLAMLEDNFGLTLELYNSAKGGSGSFTLAQTSVDAVRQADGVSQSSLDNLAQNYVHAAMDADANDPTGVGYALQAGATDLVTVLSLEHDHFSKGFNHLLRLFSGHIEYEPWRTPEKPPIFQQLVSDVEQQYATFDKLHISKECRILKGITMGTIRCDIRPNALWGLSERSVRLHVIAIEGLVLSGELQDLHDFSLLVQEIILTMRGQENMSVVSSVLLPMFA